MQEGSGRTAHKLPAYLWRTRGERDAAALNPRRDGHDHGEEDTRRRQRVLRRFFCPRRCIPGEPRPHGRLDDLHFSPPPSVANHCCSIHSASPSCAAATGGAVKGGEQVLWIYVHHLRRPGPPLGHDENPAARYTAAPEHPDDFNSIDRHQASSPVTRSASCRRHRGPPFVERSVLTPASEHLDEVEVEVEGESVPQSEGPSEGSLEGAPVGYVANCNILVEEPDSPPHQGEVLDTFYFC